MKILIIADDLTGALDSSVAFCGRGLSVVCALSPDAVAEAIARDPDVLTISVNSREGTESEAINRVETVWRQCQKHDAWAQAFLFKKVDSRLKGHVAAELSVLAPFRSRVAVTPAIPKLGRLVKSGLASGNGIAVPIPVAERAGVAFEDVIDGASDADLDRAIDKLGADTLFVGAAGLAEAIARKLAPLVLKEQPVQIEAPALFAIGSRDPITLAQLDRLKATDIDRVLAPNGEAAFGISPAQVHDCLIQLTEGADTISVQTAAERFALTCCRAVEHMRPRTLVASGGETAAAIAKHLGCGLLQVEGEALPGLPVSRMLDGLPGMRFITKSGGFGEAETLVSLYRNFIVLPADS